MAREAGPRPALRPVTARTLWLPALRRGLPAYHATQVAARPRDVDGVLYLVALFGLWALNAADMAVTLLWVDSAGWDAEGNAWLRTLAAWAGPLGFVVYKLVLMTGVVALLWGYFLYVDARVRRARRSDDVRRARLGYRILTTGTGGIIGFYVWVLVNNLQVAGLL